MLLPVLVLLLFARGEDSTSSSGGTKACTMADISLFRSLSCKEGTIGLGAGCVCSNEGRDCRLNGMRKYLPPRVQVEEAYYNKQEFKCNRMFRLSLSKYMLSTKTIVKRNGYPQDCTKPKECHKPSLGKFMCYNSLMQFHAFQGAANDTLYDFQYSYGFRWSTSVPACAAGGKVGSWDCGFLSFSQALQEQATSSDSKLEKLDAAERGSGDSASTKGFLENVLPYVDLLRREKKNHAVQLLLYARVVYLVTRASELVQKYVADHTVTLNANVATNYFKEQFKGNITLHDTNSHGLGTFHRPPPTVSMHVRQGDSCDTVLDSAVPEMTNYLSKSSSGRVTRPCFSIEVYMQALRAVREKYGTLRVFLSTDSQEMLQRAKREPSFTWVYINSSRDVFAGRTEKTMGDARYIDYLPSSANEEVLFGGLADLLLLSRGDIFLGAFSSHMSKIAYYAMVGHHLRVLPFHSLDYSLDCDTTDSCTREDVQLRNLTIEGIVTWAPECIRGVIDWSPQKDRDPCGIYI